MCGYILVPTVQHRVLQLVAWRTKYPTLNVTGVISWNSGTCTCTCILYLYQDKTRDIRSNITFCLKEFARASLSGTLSGKGVYLTVYRLSRPNTDTINFVEQPRLHWVYQELNWVALLVTNPSHASSTHLQSTTLHCRNFCNDYVVSLFLFWKGQGV